jgi:hypothetical protein
MATARADTPPRSNQYPIPDIMRAWVLGGPEELSLVEKPVPQPGATEVLVRLRARSRIHGDGRRHVTAGS